MKNSIDFWKIVFTVLIIALHCGVSFGWCMGVEFFFLVSGFLLAKSSYNVKKQRSVWSYIKNRLIRLYPTYFVSMIVYIIVFLLINKPDNISENTFIYLLENIVGSWKPILMLQPFGKSEFIPMNPNGWYVAALFWVSILLFIVLKYVSRKIIKIILPIVSIIILGIYCVEYGCMDFWETHRRLVIGGTSYEIVADSIFRAISLMSIGIILYFIWDKYNERIKGKILNVFIIFEMIGYIIVIVTSFFVGYTRLDFILLVILCFCVFVSFLPHNRAWIYSKTIKKISGWTYSIYLNQGVFIICLAPIILPSDLNILLKFIITLLCICIYSIFMDTIISKILFRRNKNAEIK